MTRLHRLEYRGPRRLTLDAMGTIGFILGAWCLSFHAGLSDPVGTLAGLTATTAGALTGLLLLQR